MLASDWLASNLLSYREKCLWFRKAKELVWAAFFLTDLILVP